MRQIAPLPWTRAWQDALYGPGGFYRGSGGPAGHFVTSAQGIPHGTRVLAEAVLALARREGLDAVVDLGAGRGELAAALHALAPGLRVTAVDIVPRPEDLPEGVQWLVGPGGAELPAQLSGLSGTLLIAHEWLDVVPCPVLARPDGIWRAVLVDPATGRESLGDPGGPAETAWTDRWLPDSVSRGEIGLPRERALTELLERMDDGLVVVVDYGHTRADRPPAGTLTGYRRGRQVAPVPDGSVDLTAHVAIDALAAAVAGAKARVHRQREVLADLLGPPTAPVHELAHTRPTAYLDLLARHTAHQTLTAPGGLGDFWWVLVRRGR